MVASRRSGLAALWVVSAVSPIQAEWTDLTRALEGAISGNDGRRDRQEGALCLHCLLRELRRTACAQYNTGTRSRRASLRSSITSAQDLLIRGKARKAIFLRLGSVGVHPVTSSPAPETGLSRPAFAPWGPVAPLKWHLRDQSFSPDQVEVAKPAASIRLEALEIPIVSVSFDEARVGAFVDIAQRRHLK